MAGAASTGTFCPFSEEGGRQRCVIARPASSGATAQAVRKRTLPPSQPKAAADFIPKECLDAVRFGVGEAVLGRSRELRGEPERGVTDESGGCVNAPLWFLRAGRVHDLPLGVWLDRHRETGICIFESIFCD